MTEYISDPDAVMTTEQAAKLLQTSPRYVQWLIKTRQLQSCQIGRRYRVRMKHIDAFLDAHEILPERHA